MTSQVKSYDVQLITAQSEYTLPTWNGSLTELLSFTTLTAANR